MRDRMRLIHFRPGGDDGGAGGASETPEEVAAREAQEAEARAQAEREAEAEKNRMVPASEAQEARREAQALRQRTKAAEEELKRLKDAQLSDQEKTAKERDEERSRADAAEKRVRDLQVQVLATKVGIVDPPAASALLDWSKIEDPEDDKQVEKALRDLVKEKTYLVPAGGGSDGGAGNGTGGGTQDMNSMIRQAAGRG